MGDLAVFLWPLIAFFGLGALASAWQAANPESEIAARRRVIDRHVEASRWKRMPLWSEYRAVQDDPAGFARSARRRAIVLAIAGLIAAAALAFG